MQKRPPDRRKICFVTGSRSDYGPLESLLFKIKADPAFLPQIVVTGAHLAPEHDWTYRDVEKSGLLIDEKIPILEGDDSPAGVAKAMGRAVIGFADAFRRLAPDMLVLSGDRFETLAAAETALVQRIPVAHVGGGDVTEGAFDEAIRHSITKMSHLHFVSNETARRRICQLGEDPARVFNVGSLAVDEILRMRFLGRRELEQRLGFRFLEKNLLVTFHPATLDSPPAVVQFREVLEALDAIGKGTGVIFTHSNADPEGLSVSRMIDGFVSSHPGARAFVSLGRELYLSVMKQCDVVVGNSSSGLYEAPSLKVATVNIGDRQKGRLAASSVVHCGADRIRIAEAVRKALKMDCADTVNLYGDGHAAERIHAKLGEITDVRALLKKRFADVWADPEKRTADPPRVSVPPTLRGLTADGSVPSDAERGPRDGRVYIIAEAGVNHNGSVARAKEMIACAASAGADAVKFQTFRTEEVITDKAEKTEYQKRTTGESGSQKDMAGKLELDEEAHAELVRAAAERGIEFLSTPFDAESVDLLARRFGLKRLKVASGEVTHFSLLLKMARTGLPLIVSTGMASLEEVEDALSVIAFGYVSPADAGPSRRAFRGAFQSAAGRRALSEKVALLHCTTEYPAPADQANLRAMDTLRQRFGLPVGLSDHTAGIAVALAGVARGAAVIEKHFTLDKNLPGPDHRASLEPHELADLVRGIREIEGALGTGIKAAALCEMKNLPLVRRSLVARTPIKKGELFTEGNLGAKRPGTGMSPVFYWDILAKRASRDYEADDLIAETP